MPKHGTGLGAASFPAANKLLMRYEADRAYRMHQQKIANVKTRIDRAAPPKQNHLVLRLKQIQKEEERQAEIDHENKLLLAKMTNVMKYGGNIDNWNNYESRSLNFPFREKMNEDIARENIGIARRLETVRPKLQINAWERDYSKHKYLKRLWNDSVKDFGEFTPRRFRSRMSQARSLETGLDETFDDDQSYDASDERKLPKLHDKSERQEKGRHQTRQTKSETNGPVSSRREKDKKTGEDKSASRFPKINSNKALVEHDYSMYYENQLPRSPRVSERVNLVKRSDDDKQKEKGSQQKKKKKERKETNNDDIDEKNESNENVTADQKDVERKSFVSYKSVNAVHGNDLERVKTLISEEADKDSDNGSTDKVSKGDDTSVDSRSSGDPQAENVSKNGDESSDKNGSGDTKSDNDKANVKDGTASDAGEKDSINDASKTGDDKSVTDANDQDKSDRDIHKSDDDGMEAVITDNVKSAEGDGPADESSKTETSDGTSAGNDRLKSEEDGNNSASSHAKDNEKANGSDNEDNQIINSKDTMKTDDSETNNSEPKDTSNVHLQQSEESPFEQNNEHERRSVNSDKTNELKAESENIAETKDIPEEKPNDSKDGTDIKAVEETANNDHATNDNSQPSLRKTEEDGSPSKKRSEKAKSGKPVSGNRSKSNSGRTSSSSVKEGAYGTKSKEDGVTNSKAASSEDDKSDVAQLFKIAKQLGKPQDIMIRTLIKKTHKQRMGIKAKFRKKYDLDLTTELKQGLGQKWENLIDALLQERGVADAYAAFDALSAKKPKKTSDFSDVVELLCSRSNADLAELKEAYRKEFSLSLEEDITDRTQPPVQTLLLILQKGDRDEGDSVDENAARKDAAALYESGEGRWDSENGKFLMLLNTRSSAHLRAVFMEYKMVAEGQEILEAMKKECSKEYYLAVQTLVRSVSSPADHYAAQLHKHKQPSDPVLINTLVIRSEIDLPQIRKAYKRLYHVDITEDIKNIQHPTQQCLVELAIKGSVGKSKQNTTEPRRSNNTKAAEAPATQSKPARKKQPSHKASDASEHSPQKVHTDQKNQSMKASDNREGSSNDNKKTESTSESSKGKRGGGGGGGNSRDNQKVKEKEKKDGDHNGTVKPVSNFKPEEDCDKLNTAMSGSTTNDQVIVSIIPRRSNKQRQQLKVTYEQMFKKNLMIDLESELLGDLEEMVLALMMTPEEYDAYVLHEAVEGLGTSETTLIAILATRSGKEMNKIASCYKKAYKTDLEMDVTRDSQGDFQTLLIQLCKGQREAGTAVDMTQAQRDAKLLYKDGQLDVYGETFLNLLSRKNSFQVKATFEEYKKLSGEEVSTGIRKAGLQDDEEAYISIVQAVEDPVLFYSQKIHECLDNMHANDNALIRIIVSRSEVDLKEIKERYCELYGPSLYSVIDQNCQADHRAMLLAVLDNEKEQQSKLAKKPKASKDPSKATVQFATDSIQDDVDRLKQALSGSSVDESVLLDILPRRTAKQRQEIQKKYMLKNEQSLRDALMSGLGSEWSELVHALTLNPVQYTAHALRDDRGSLDTLLVTGTLATLSGKEISAIQEEFQEVYSQSLAGMVDSETEETVRGLLSAMLTSSRDTGGAVNEQQATRDARALVKENEQKIDPCDVTYKELMTQASPKQVMATFEAYKQITGQDVYKTLRESDLSTHETDIIDIAKGVSDPIQFYTDCLHRCLSDTSSDNKHLIWILVSRSEIDLADIQKRYEQTYKHPLREKVEQACRAGYKQMLLEIMK